jgi:hypothetical protein
VRLLIPAALAAPLDVRDDVLGQDAALGCTDAAYRSASWRDPTATSPLDSERSTVVSTGPALKTRCFD